MGSFRHDEHGSLPLVLLLAIILGGVVVALFTDVRMGQQTAREDRDFNQSVQVADAGIQSAFTVLADFDGDDPECPAGTTNEGTVEDLVCVSTGDVSEGNYEWTATRVGHERWQVRSEGTFRGSTRALEAMVGPRQIFPLAAFGDELLNLVGANTVSSYPQGGQGYVGSNHEIRLHGNATVDWVVRYGDATFNHNGEYGGVTTESKEAYFPNLAERAYADGGVCHEVDDIGAFDGSSDQLVRGETYCFSDVRFVNRTDHKLADDPTDDDPGPTRIFVAPSGNLTVEGQGSNAATVNIDPEDSPDASALEIYLASGEVRLGNHTEIAAGIYAPTSVCKGAGGDGGGGSQAHATVHGAIICNTLESQGGWTFNYDERLGDATDETHEVSGWREEFRGTTSFAPMGD